MSTNFFLLRPSSLFHSPFSPTLSATLPRSFHLKATMMSKSEITEENEVGVSERKKIFVAGATGGTGKKIVEQLLSRGFAVKAGVRDIDKAKASFAVNNQYLEFVKADVTEGSAKLAEAIGDNSDAVVCATGFRRSWDLLAPWKVANCDPSSNILHMDISIHHSAIVPSPIHLEPQGLSQLPTIIFNFQNCVDDICTLYMYVMLDRQNYNVWKTDTCKVDNFGTVNLVDACNKCSVKRFILISSILVNGAAMGQILNPAYIILNVLGLTLIAKLQAEQYIRKSGINYTIVRPGGLRSDPPKGNIVMEPEDTLYDGSISRDQVAEVAVEALLQPESSYKVVEIVARTEAPKRSFEELFGSIKQK